MASCQPQLELRPTQSTYSYEFLLFLPFFFFLSWLLRAENLISAKIHQIRLEWPKLLTYHTNIIAKKKQKKQNKKTKQNKISLFF